MKRALFQIHLAVLLWGFTGVLGRAISLSAPVLVWYRMLITAVFLCCIITYRNEWRKYKQFDFFKVTGIGVLFAIHWVAFYASVKLANASIAMVCLATASIFTALLDPLINKGKFNSKEILLSLLAVAGVFCIYFLQPSGNKGADMPNFQLGVALGVAASIISAIFTVFNKPLTVHYPARLLVFTEMSTGFLFLSALAPFYILQMPAEPLLPQGWDYLWLFLLSYCCTVWGQSLAMNALRNLSPFTVTLSVNLEPVYGIMLAFLIFQENQQLGYGFYLGMGLIFLSLLLQVALIVHKNKKARHIHASG